MRYAKFEDIAKRCKRNPENEELCIALLDDAAIIIDSFNRLAPPDAKKLVSCNMVMRAIGGGEDAQVPIGATQGTVSALGYSQTWAMSSGTSGELYLSKLDKKLLKTGVKIGFRSPIETESEYD